MCPRDFQQELGSDLTQVAGLLSQFSAVLAGFAFAGALLVVERFHSDDVLNRPIAALITSFMSLLIATFLYATVAGEEYGSTRAAALNAVTGVIFATGLLMMVNGVTRLLTATRPSIPTGLLKLLVLAVPLTTLAYLDTVTITLISTLDCNLLDLASARFAAIAIATLYFAAVIGWLWWRWDAAPTGLLAWACRPVVQRRYERVVVIAVVATILLAAVVTRLPRDLYFSPLAASLAQAAVAILLTFYTVGLQSHTVSATGPRRVTTQKPE